MFRVLLVDDEELALVSLRYSFPWEEYGFTDIITTTDPRYALQCLTQQQIDAAFVDIRMPEITGLELIQKARENHSAAQFVIVSGYSDFAYAKEALHLGALDYCLKPVSSDEAVFTLKKLFEQIYMQRLAQDPQLAALLLSDLSSCQDFLQKIQSDDTLSETLTLVYVRANELRFLSQITKQPPLFLLFSVQEALLIWNLQLSESELSNLLAPFFSQALFITDYTKSTANAFQASIKRLRVECHNRCHTETGFIQLSNISSEMTDYFSSMLSYIDNHYAENLKLQDLSHQFGVNYTYLSQLFKKMIGKSFPEYLTGIRLSHAQRLLSDTEMKITLIAETVGFNDYHYFCNVFKNNFSMSPAQYRNAMKRNTSA